MMNEYKQLIREIAEEMATAAALKTGIPHYIPDYDEAARVAVKRMSDSYIEGYMSN